MVAASAEPRFRTIVIVGGGCYGSFYAEQLRRGRERGAVQFDRVLVVDRDPACPARRSCGGGAELVVEPWDRFFDGWLAGGAGEADAIVPSPLMPHLLFEWIERRARARWPARTIVREAIDDPVGTPFDVSHADGTRYVSYADWLCPVHCIEPLVCPKTRAPRTWEMARAVEELGRRRSRSRRVAGPIVLQCRHRAYGVGMIDAGAVLAGDRLVADAGAEPGAFEAIVGTLSSCHGAVSAFRVEGD